MKYGIQIVKDEMNGMAYIITKLASTGNGIKMSFRTYSTKHECGGFETTVIINGANIAHAAAFCGDKAEIKSNASVFGLSVVRLTTNNIVSDKFTYQAVRNRFK